MKLLLSLGLCLSLSSPAFSQKKGTLNAKDQAIVEHFKTEYKKKNYKRFEGKITAKDIQVQFDNKIIYYDKSDKVIASLLKEGLIYPQLLTDYQMEKFLDETTDKTQKRFLKLQKDPRASFDVNNVKLSNIKELTFTSSNPKAKRFKITFKDNRINSTIYYLIELTNKNAKENTSLDEFIKGSSLTYLDQTE
ncbi:hypothetical protein PFY12_00930 [Chryseobacterium camelliae]|uniref:Outer membrane lipoprotein carrier protein LolA n=1 Tax=Chryseobacterium camelliae TaxID=1265445 RepID=A0ABY7QNT0_9FLAO|nr:hypothetical protein [Chryseobacterium camelliae]WBV60696.1 hypothetical protein PFY12_00930 [Chryseobacterium camelliae]